MRLRSSLDTGCKKSVQCRKKLHLASYSFITCLQQPRMSPGQSLALEHGSMLCCAGQQSAYTSNRPCSAGGQIHTVSGIQAASASPFQIRSLAALQSRSVSELESNVGIGVCPKVGLAGDCC